MPQVSKRIPSQVVEERMFEVFEKTFLDLKSVEDARLLLGDLLTRTEKIMVAKRLAIAVLLAKDYDYRSITNILKVSFSTINAILKQQVIDGRGYKKAVDKILKNESLDEFYTQLAKNISKVLCPHPASHKRIEASYRKKITQRNRKII